MIPFMTAGSSKKIHHCDNKARDRTSNLLPIWPGLVQDAACLQAAHTQEDTHLRPSKVGALTLHEVSSDVCCISRPNGGCTVCLSKHVAISREAASVAVRTANTAERGRRGEGCSMGWKTPSLAPHFLTLSSYRFSSHGLYSEVTRSH